MWERTHPEPGRPPAIIFQVPATAHPRRKTAPRSARSQLGSALRWLAVALAALWLACALSLVAFRWINPPTTAVHAERRLESWFSSKPYRERYDYVPLSHISPNLQHAVIAAEDARFYQHHGFDWHQIRLDAGEDMDGGRLRGASTLDQQLVKNLFFGTGRSVLRKVAEASLVPVAELALGKRRILELYLNEVEWGPGVYGAQAACEYWDRTAARAIGRDDAARLAAILPAPRRWHPQRMGRYSAIIESRMAQMGW